MYKKECSLQDTLKNAHSSIVSIMDFIVFSTVEYYRELRMYKVLLHTTTEINLMNNVQLITETENSE